MYLAWSGYAYGRAGYGVPAPEAMQRRFALIDVAVKNQDNREHDIFDSDDYLQEHGGMVATVRALRGGQAPQAFFGDSADPERPRVRSLAEEARRVVRSRVLNPRWISAMMRHGYKGAFEMAATVDYLYGYDATARIGEDWMYEQVTAGLRRRPRGAEVLRRLQPLGAPGHRRAAPRSRRPGPVERVRHRHGDPAGRTARSRRLGRGAPVVTYPLSAIVGQDDLKLALLLHAVDPKLGGVLIRGEKGSGKSTAARALATLLPADPSGRRRRSSNCRSAPPRTASSARSTSRAPCSKGGPGSGPGLLAAAHGGVLYVDEVNLLADHLVDVLIDAAAFGVNRIERDGLDRRTPLPVRARRVDEPRGGRAAPPAPRPVRPGRRGAGPPRSRSCGPRSSAAAWPSTPHPDDFAERFAADEDGLRAAIADAAAILGDVVVPDEVLALTSRLCAELDAEGLRADLVLARGRRPPPPSTAARRPPSTTSSASRRWPWPTAAAAVRSTPPASLLRSWPTPSPGRAATRAPADRRQPGSTDPKGDGDA